MDLYLQMGHGMKSHILDLITKWNKGYVIFSPANMEQDKLEKFSKEIKRKNGKVLLDPQLYFPHKYHKNLSQYSYWCCDDVTNLVSGKTSYHEILKPLVDLNQTLDVQALILPSFFSSVINDRWDDVQKKIIDGVCSLTKDLKLFHTISLSKDLVMDETQVEKIISYIENWDVEGLYIVCEHPNKTYLVDNPLWISNLLSLVTGIKRLHKKVIVGYANHQMLCLSLAKCDAIASGNFLNVRSFESDRFETIDSDNKSRRSVWYYSPQALSEYKIPYLDLAKKERLLDSIVTSGNMKSQYSDMLFSAGKPSSSGYGERESFRHYLWCLKNQCLSAVRSTYKETLDAQLITLETADQILSAMRKNGIRGQDRDFSDFVDVNRAAIAAHKSSFEFVLTKEWDSL
jgi:hypothetical protein